MGRVCHYLSPVGLLPLLLSSVFFFFSFFFSLILLYFLQSLGLYGMPFGKLPFQQDCRRPA